jgi:PTS system cellobiose-specific IIB component
MQKILLCCGAGMSSSLLASRMQVQVKEKNLNAKVWAVSVGELNATIKEGVDVVLIGPQIRYKIKDVESICQEFGAIPCGLINSVDYGTMNAEKVLAAAIKLIEKNS